MKKPATWTQADLPPVPEGWKWAHEPEPGAGFGCYRYCSKTGTTLAARVRPLADGSWQGWALARHPKAWGVEARADYCTCATLEGAMKFALEHVRILAAWVRAKWE